MLKSLKKLEEKALGWSKSLPNLPNETRKWLGENTWWIIIVGITFMIINILRGLDFVDRQVSLQGSIAGSYYLSTTVSEWAIFTATVSLVFLMLQVILLGAAVQPLKTMQKKAWVLLFASWLLSAVALVINGLLTLGIISFMITVLFGAVWIAITGYFLFEIHGQFAHVQRSTGFKKAK